MVTESKKAGWTELSAKRKSEKHGQESSELYTVISQVGKARWALDNKRNKKWDVVRCNQCPWENLTRLKPQSNKAIAENISTKHDRAAVMPLMERILYLHQFIGTDNMGSVEVTELVDFVSISFLLPYQTVLHYAGPYLEGRSALGRPTPW
ncbi:hypothetical protein HKX48_006567 [Thoreauomyces humboldtii]|nr:hypothetical protein HKX48_006567 [Thoreauomyces humboldtii]